MHSLKGLNHPDIAKLFEVITTQDKAYLFMEHASEGTLFDHLENSGLMMEKEAQACSDNCYQLSLTASRDTSYIGT